MNRRNFLTTSAAVAATTLAGCQKRELTLEEKSASIIEIIQYTSNSTLIQKSSKRHGYKNWGSDEFSPEAINTPVPFANLRRKPDANFTSDLGGNITPMEAALIKGWDEKSIQTLKNLGAKERPETKKLIEQLKTKAKSQSH